MLERLRSGAETVEAAYAVWAELQAELTQRQVWFASEHRRLDEESRLVLGAVRSARAPNQEVGLARFVDESRLKLEALRAKLEAHQQHELGALKLAVAQARSEARARVVRQASLVKPMLRMTARTLPEGRRILHAERLSGDDAVSLCFALSGRVPSRYGFLFDDAIDDVSEAGPAWLYADEGVAASETKPTPSALEALLGSRAEVWPLKGMLVIPLGRFRQRGPVMEVEVADGEGFRNVLTQDEAERVLGALLSLKLEGRIELVLTHF